MKNLANCKPSEFLKQTVKIKRSVEKWLTDTDILSIRQNAPTLETVPADASAEEKIRVINENKRRMTAQSRANLSKMLDAILEDHPDETLELLALLCFVEPDHVDDYPMSEYISAISDMIGDEAVIGFFTSLVRLGQMNTSD